MFHVVTSFSLFSFWWEREWERISNDIGANQWRRLCRYFFVVGEQDYRTVSPKSRKKKKKAKNRIVIEHAFKTCMRMAYFISSFESGIFSSKQYKKKKIRTYTLEYSLVGLSCLRFHVCHLLSPTISSYHACWVNAIDCTVLQPRAI